MSEQSIRLGVREIIREAISTHFIRKDGTEISAFHTHRAYDVAELIERRVAIFVRDAVERDKVQEEMAAEQPMAGPDSSTIRPMTATEADPTIIRSGDEVAIMWPGEKKPMKGTIHHIGGKPSFSNLKNGRALTKDEILSEVVAWCKASPLLLFKDVPFRFQTIEGTVMVFMENEGFRGEFI